jgi:hypothetical protein
LRSRERQTNKQETRLPAALQWGVDRRPQAP